MIEADPKTILKNVKGMIEYWKAHFLKECSVDLVCPNKKEYPDAADFFEMTLTMLLNQYPNVRYIFDRDTKHRILWLTLEFDDENFVMVDNRIRVF